MDLNAKVREELRFTLGDYTLKIIELQTRLELATQENQALQAELAFLKEAKEGS
jgi:hypothetical protein